jgi:hypothetical protein
MSDDTLHHVIPWSVNFWGGFVTAWTSILVGTVVAVLKLWP